MIDPEAIEAAKASLIGTLVGDSLGLPYEGLSAQRGARLMPFPLRQRLLFGRGAPSDDTVQSFLLFRALMESVDAPRRFAEYLRIWFLAAPPGIRLSTLKACVRLCIGFGPERSGLNSAGNGAAMRAAVVGALYANDAKSRVRLVEATSRVTHTHPLAIQGAQLIALAAALSAQRSQADFESEARHLCPDWPWDTPIPVRGPTGYVVHSVNAALQIWRKGFGDPQKAIEQAIALGGDTDSVGAMLGGILGAANPIWPTEWLRTVGYPSITEIQSLPRRAKGAIYLRLLASNLATTPTILLFGFRRLLPPY